MATTPKRRPARKAVPAVPLVPAQPRRSSQLPHEDVQQLVADLNLHSAKAVLLANAIGRTLQDFGYLLAPWQHEALEQARCSVAVLRLSLRGLACHLAPEVAHG